MQKTYVTLLNELRENSRESLTRLSKKTGIPISTIYDKLKEFNQSYITKHTILVDFRKLGYALRVSFLIKTSKHNKEQVKDFLKTSATVNNMYKINSGFDFVVECVFKDLDELDHFERRLEDFELEKIERFFILEEIKRESFTCFTP
jgi:DNA-binding Lrp family transcriptional regulator